MAQIIASAYELEEKIGAGGAGVVYLGRHLRLGKKVVLKADKRTLSAKPETLRREVDALKNLSHQYIPQVYDFVVEGETVYTVMDYIEGESLDKALKRGVRFKQADIIKWACQLLDALCYLHSRPPHGILHSDIKPANIMLTPQGDIRLIDFNIALALGEDGAVRMGYSQGYASPEHYGIDYSRSGSSSSRTRPTVEQTTILLDENDQPLSLSARTGLQRTGKTGAPGSQGTDSRSSSARKTILLDVRSDIYSLGATLYHLLTGEKPAKDAKDIIPLQPSSEVSRAVADIINKSMQPDPDDRYQSAEEMLQAFTTLREHDFRAVKRRRNMRVTTIFLAAIFLIGGASTFVGLRQLQKESRLAELNALEAEQAAKENEEAAKLAEEEAQRREEEARLAEEEARLAEEAERLLKQAEQAAKEALESVRGAESAYADGDIPGAVSLALTALEKDTIYNSQAQRVLTDALGVYELSDGFKSFRTADLDAAPLEMNVSPDGKRLAVISDFKLEIFDLKSGEKLDELPTEESALADVVFLDGDTVVYASPGAIRAYSISSRSVLWTGERATGIVRSSDGSRIAAVYTDERHATVYNASTGAVIKVVDFLGRSQPVLENNRFADPKDAIFELNSNGSMLAVSFSDGSLDVFNIDDPDGDILLLDDSDYSHFEGGFCGDYFAFSAKNAEKSIFIVIDTVRGVQTAGTSSASPYLVRTDEQFIYLANQNLLVSMNPTTGEQKELAYPASSISGFATSGEYVVITTNGKSYEVYGPGAQRIALTETNHTCDFLEITGQYLIESGHDTPIVHILRLEGHSDAELFAYDPYYVHDEARISADGSTVMLFRFDSFRLYSMDGTIIADVNIPDSNKVYDQQYRRNENGSWLEVIYADGLIRTYSAADGSLLSEIQGQIPDETLYEEFLTDHWKITSPLHGVPAVYDRETGELVRELEKDAYLTYVTQVGDNVITEYTTAQGERYGLLLNDQCEIIAYLPNLCDVLDGTLVFDTPSGSLRTSRIFTLGELSAMANSRS